MNRTIWNRIQAAERSCAPLNVPDLVIIYCDESGQWYAKEQYTRHNARGAVIIGTGRERVIPLDSPADYKTPEGFRGVIISGGVE